jgi:hypothetical protein
MQYYAFVEEKQKVHCLNTLFSKVRSQPPMLRTFVHHNVILCERFCNARS